MRWAHTRHSLAKEKGAKSLFPSTSEIYGDPEEHPRSESHWGNVDQFGPRSCFDESKKYGVAIVRIYRDEYNLDILIARIFNNYVPPMRLDDDRVVPTFTRQAVADDELTVYGKGEQTRSFCYVADMIGGLMALLESDVDTPVNLGNPDKRTINVLAEIIIDLSGSDSEITHEPAHPQDP